MLYYKVVCEEKGKLYSTNGLTRVEYKLNTWTLPKIKGSRLFIFSSLTQANLALSNLEGSRHRIYECKATNVIPARYCYKEVEFNEKRNHERWKIFNEFLKKHKATHFPFVCLDGTLFAKKVKLLKRIW